jgi:hypothetical protein
MSHWHPAERGLFETGSFCIAQADLELSVLLPQPLKCWDHGVHHHAWLPVLVLRYE